MQELMLTKLSSKSTSDLKRSLYCKNSDLIIHSFSGTTTQLSFAENISEIAQCAEKLQDTNARI